MTIVYSLKHFIVRNGVRDRKGIGVYTSELRPVEVMETLGHKPGFSDPRGAFSQTQVSVGSAYLPNGYDAGTDTPIALPGFETSIRGDHAFELEAINVVDAQETDDDFVLISLFATRADALKAAEILASRIDLKRYRLEVFEKYIDRDNWTTGFVSDN